METQAPAGEMPALPQERAAARKNCRITGVGAAMVPMRSTKRPSQTQHARGMAEAVAEVAAVPRAVHPRQAVLPLTASTLQEPAAKVAQAAKAATV